MKPNNQLLFVALSALLYASGMMTLSLYMLYNLMELYVQGALNPVVFRILL